MFTKTLLPDTLWAIKLAATIPTVQRAYLAGGTALALQLGHRMSVDLDFFTKEKFDENLVATELSQLSLFQEDQRAWASVLGRISKTRFSIFYYKYKIIDPLITFEGINLIGKKDIAAMKIHAISDRGVKRDFIDVFMLAKEFTIDQMFNFYEEKYGSLDDKLYQLIKGLSYFADAEDDDMPEMLLPVKWEEVKDFFRQESRRLASEKLNIDF